ncbi:MAG: hypothetical protein RJB13_1956 [Pseudomonadota bacterium]|jgi:hypothetical protein
MIITLWGLPFIAKASIISAYYFGHTEGYQSGSYSPVSYTVLKADDLPHRDEGRDLGTSWGGVEAKYSLKLSTQNSFFESEHPLLKNNKMTTTLSMELSPVSINVAGITSWEPVPFAKLDLGAATGTGWSLLGFNGLGRNFENEADVRKEPVSGLVNKVWIEPALQFDWAAIQPGEWNHIVAFSSASFEYRNFTGAKNDQVAWEFENDQGANLNGWRRLENYLVGYQMPLDFSLIGILATTEQLITHKNDSTMANSGWGSDFKIWNFGPMGIYNLSESSRIINLIQWRTEQGYTDETVANRYFRNRVYNRPVTRLYRIAFNYESTF